MQTSNPSSASRIAIDLPLNLGQRRAEHFDGAELTFLSQIQ
jgi:hypothetical protein